MLLVLSQRGNKAPKAAVSFSSPSTAFCLSRTFHAQPTLSFLHDYLSFQGTEDFHRTARRVWPRFQPEFCPRCSDHSPQEGQTCTCTLSGVKGRHPAPSPTKKRPLFPTGVFFLSTSTHSAADLHVRQIQNGVRTFTSLLSPFSPVITVITLFEALGAISRGFGDRQCCASGATIACRWCALASCFRLARIPQPWISLPTMSITGHSQWAKKYGYLSYLRHVVLGLDEVDHLVHTVTEELGTCSVTTPFPFPDLLSTSTLPEFVASSKHSCVGR